MPETPDPDPLTKVIGALRTAVDDLARLAEHPTVKNMFGALLGALGRDDPATAAPEPSRGSQTSASSGSASAKPGPRARKAPAADGKRPAATKPTAATKRPRATKPTGQAAPTSGGGPVKPSRSSGRRADLLALVEQHPGISISDAAKQIGIAPGGLYGVARKLESDGLIRKEGNGWVAAGRAD